MHEPSDRHEKTWRKCRFGPCAPISRSAKIHGERGVTTTAVAAASLEALTQHQPWMFARAYEYTGNRADAQEAVQESYLRYIERAPAEVENLKAYLSKILENVLHTSKRGFGKFETPSDEMADAPFPALSPEQEYELAERKAQTQQGLSDLKPVQRRVLLLLSEGLSPREIAPILGMTPHAVSAREMRAKINLRIALIKRGFVPVLIPFFRLKSRLGVWADALRYQPLDALAFISVTVLVPMILSVLPPTSIAPITDATRGLTSIGGDNKLPNEVGFLPAQHLELRNLAESRAGSNRPNKESVTRVEAPANTTFIVEEEDRQDTPEPSLQEQVLGYVGEPGSVPVPGCDGTVPCP